MFFLSGMVTVLLLTSLLMGNDGPDQDFASDEETLDTDEQENASNSTGDRDSGYFDESDFEDRDGISETRLFASSDDADTLEGSIGNDWISGQAGADQIGLGVGNDTAFGGAGNDIVYGNANGDSLYGDTGNDRLEGQSGDDHLLGDIGDDTLYGGNQDDTVNGGSGDDAIYGGIGDDFLTAGPGSDSLNGGFGNDTLLGATGDDVLFGGFGNDLIDGRHDPTNSDFLNGGHGDDTLISGAGDYLHGGAGADVFQFTATTDQSTTISDFTQSEDKVLIEVPSETIQSDIRIETNQLGISSILFNGVEVAQVIGERPPTLDDIMVIPSTS